MPILQKLEELSDDVQQYLLLNLEILKFETINLISIVGSSVISSLIIGLSAFLFIVTLSIGLGFYLSALLGDSYSGFAIIAAFYFLLTIILIVGRKKMIEKPLRNKIIKKILEDNYT